MNQIERKPPSSELLRTFVAIAEAETLTSAAERLGRTQSAISVQLKKLEETLGVSLFDRHVRGMTLSDKGRILLPAARRALAALQQTTALFDAPMRGRIAVGIPDDYDDMILESALAAFAARNPGVEIVAQSGCTAAYPAALASGALDIAICSGPQPMEGEVLNAAPTVWACSASLALDEGAPIPLALLDRDCWWRDIPTDALTKAGRQWRQVYRSGSFTSQRAAIRAGLGIGVLPASSVDQGMRVLGAADGMPPLPLAHRTIVTRPGAPTDLTRAMAAAFRRAVIGG